MIEVRTSHETWLGVGKGGPFTPRCAGGQGRDENATLERLKGIGEGLQMSIHGEDFI